MSKTWFFFLGLFVAIQNAHASGVTPIKEIFSPDASTYQNAQYFKVAVIQWANDIDTPVNVSIEVAEAYKKTNREALAEYMREAKNKGAKLVVTPEFAVVGYPEGDLDYTRTSLTPYVETVPGPSTEYFSKLARELKMTIHFGLAEKDSKTNLYYNTQVAIGEDGKILAKYRKQNLFFGESAYLSPGKEFVSYESPVGKIGLAICADIYSGRVISGYKALGIKVLTVPTSWTIFNSAMSYFQNASKSFNAYILGANHYYFPDSGVVSPGGNKQSHIRQSMGVAYGYIPLLKRASLR